MKKKLISLISLALILGLSACGGGGSSSSSASSSSAPSSSSQPSSQSSSSSIDTRVTVTFDGNGSVEDFDPVKVEPGQKVEQPDDPTRPGKKFVGWYNGEDLWDFDDPVTEAMTLTAKWVLSVDPALEDRAVVDVNPGQFTELCVYDGSEAFEITEVGGHWYLNGDIDFDWKTCCIFDAEGKLCWAVWCPANGYGNPSAYTYSHHYDYSAQQDGYTQNPAFVITSAEDWKIVIPEGGFALISQNETSTGSSWIVSSLSNGEQTELRDDQPGLYGREFNTPNCQWSNVTMKFDAAKEVVEVYKLATSLSFVGNKCGIAEGDASTGEYTVSLDLLTNNRLRFRYDSGLRTSILTDEKTTFVGDFNDSGEPDGTNRLYILQGEEEDGGTLIAPKACSVTFTYNVNTKTMNIEITSTPVGPIEVLKLAVSSKDSDSEFAMWSAGTVLHNEANEWSAATGSPWRHMLVIDADGRICYFCVYPTNGYGGPTGASYGRHSVYSNYQDNPALELKPGFGPWTPEDASASKKWELKVPTGGIGLTGHGSTWDAIINALTEGAIEAYSDEDIGKINKTYDYQDYLKVSYDSESNSIKFIENKPVASKSQAHKESAQDAMPAIFFDNTTLLADKQRVAGCDYVLGIDGSGTVIFAAYHGDGYSGPSDGFYHDGKYPGAIAGQVCGIFNVHADYAPWSQGSETPTWENYNLQVPTGGCIICGNSAQMELIVNQIFGITISDYEKNYYFECVAEDGEFNDKVVSFEVDAEDDSVYNISVL